MIQIRTRTGKGLFSGALGAFLGAFFFASSAFADISAWQKGADVTPTYPAQFSSAEFQQSLRNLKATNANAVGLVVQLYQSNDYSSDIQAGQNTATDGSLADAIKYAHSLGMQVTVKIHVDPYGGDWRAFINPGNRAAWFAAYDAELVHYAAIAQQNGAEYYVVGTELISVSSDDTNSTNTANWVKMIGDVRKVYGGKLEYAANVGDGWGDEKDRIKFWNLLDYAGLDAYYKLGTNWTEDSQAAYQGYWAGWYSSNVLPFEQAVQKPIIFTEVGYKSVTGGHTDPGNYAIGGGYNGQEQADAYAALFSYWANVPFLKGVYVWEWKADPNAGGPGDTDYTPQGKPAQAVMTSWFGGSNKPVLAPNVSAAASAQGASVALGSPMQATVTVTNGGGDLQNGIVDIEIYDQSGRQVYQTFSSRTLSASSSAQFPISWTPSTAGTYYVAVGVFSGDWTRNYLWNANAGNFSAVAAAPLRVALTATGSNGAAQPNQQTSSTVMIANSGDALQDSIVDVEVYSGNVQVFQQFFAGQPFAAGQSKPFSILWTPANAGIYTIAAGVFSGNWSRNYLWNGSVATVTAAQPVVTPPPAPVATTTPPAAPVSSAVIDVWWPTTQSTISGTLPFKALVEGADVSQYQMSWQVDGGALNAMYSSNDGYPHKETWADVSSWNWRGSGPYTITFVAKDQNGAVIASKDVAVTVAR